MYSWHAKRRIGEECTFFIRGLRGFFIASFRLVIFGYVAAGFVGREGEEGGGEEDITLWQTGEGGESVLDERGKWGKIV